MAAVPGAFQIGAKTTPAQAAANYTSGAAAKGTKWATNYLHSKVDPFEAAAAAAQTWLSNVNKAGTAGFQAGLSRVNRAQIAAWVQQHGASQYTSGISNKGTPRYAAAAASLIPAIQQAAAALPPRGTDQDNVNRMIQMVQQLKAMRGQYRAR
jgi:hypothetical protein